MPLPLKAAADLAKDMAKKGISGSISMGKPEMKHMGSGDAMDDSPEKDSEDMDPAMMDIAGEMFDAVESKDKVAWCKLFKELCDRMKDDDEEQDHEMMESQDSSDDSSY